MTRGNNTKLEIKRDWTSLKEIMDMVVERCKPELGMRKLSVDIKDNLPMLFVDSILIEQVLFNVVGNACDLSDPNSVINFSAIFKEDDIIMEFKCYPGNVKKDELEQIVESLHYTGTHGDNQYEVAAQRFTICHGIIEAHGGKITVDSGDSDITVTILLPFHPLDMQFAEPDLDEEIAKIE